jgi:hypothetical protein
LRIALTLNSSSPSMSVRGGGGAYQWYDLGTIPMHRPMQVSDAYWSSYKKADDLPHTRSQRLSACTKSMTICSPFLRINPLQRLVFSVCPAYYCL